MARQATPGMNLIDWTEHPTTPARDVRSGWQLHPPTGSHARCIVVIDCSGRLTLIPDNVAKRGLPRWHANIPVHTTGKTRQPRNHNWQRNELHETTPATALRQAMDWIQKRPKQ